MAEQVRAEECVAKLGSLAAEVGAVYDAQQSARAAESEAEAAVLSMALDAARLGLRAVCGRLLLGERTWWRTSVETESEETFSEWRGAVLLGKDRARDNPRADSGAVTGWHLVLRDDGHLLRVTYQGTWTKWQGASSGWTSTVEALTPRQAVDEVADLDLILAALVKLLESHGTAKRVEATAKAVQRTERLRAILALAK